MTTKKRVLLVDDEPGVQRVLAEGLGANGYAVETCSDGLSALRLFATRQTNGAPFDAVVTEVRLPDIDGIKLLRIIRSRYPGTAVIVASGYVRDDTPEKLATIGGAPLLHKPVSADALVAALADLESAALDNDEADRDEPASAYVFVELTDGADRTRLFAALCGLEGVLRVDAVLGRWDVVLRVEAESEQALRTFASERVGGLAGVLRTRLMPTRSPELPASIRDYISSYESELAEGTEEPEEPKEFFEPQRTSSYAIIEVAPEAVPALYPMLYFIDEVTEIDADTTGETIVLMLQADDPVQIRKVLNDKVDFMDGVLRIEDMMVIDMSDPESVR